MGYGDIGPETDTGRVIAIALMVVSIGFVALITGALAERFLSTQGQETEEQEVLALSPGEAQILAKLDDMEARLARLEDQRRR